MNQTHPNAAASVVTGGLAGLAIYILGRCGIDLTPTDGAAVAGALTAVVLFVGRRGIRGTIAALWNGSSQPPAPPAV